MDANTATINISGTGALAAGNVNYNGTTFNLNGTAHTVSGNFTANLGFNPAGDQTITWTDGMAITVTDMFRGGTGLITWPQSGPLGFDIIKYGGGYLNSRIFHTHQHFSQIVVIPPICPPGKMTSARLTRLGGFN